MNKIILLAVILLSLLSVFNNNIVQAKIDDNNQPKVEKVSFFQRIIRWFFGKNTDSQVDIAKVDKRADLIKKNLDFTKYSNSKLGFEISYPKDLNIDLNSEYYCKGRVDCGDENGEKLYIYNYKDDGSYDRLRKELLENEFQITISIKKHSAPQTLETIIPTYNEAKDRIISERIILNNYDVAVIKNEWESKIIYYLVNKNTEVEMNVKYSKVDENISKEIENIVSSINFTR